MQSKHAVALPEGRRGSAGAFGGEIAHCRGKLDGVQAIA